MREYIKCNHRAAVMLFRRGSEADFDRADAIDAHNTGIASRAYTGIMEGRFDYAYIRNGVHLIVYTRSTRGNFIQASYFSNLDGDTVATMHSNITSPDKMRDTFIPGRYITMEAAA